MPGGHALTGLNCALAGEWAGGHPFPLFVLTGPLPYHIAPTEFNPESSRFQIVPMEFESYLFERLEKSTATATVTM